LNYNTFGFWLLFAAVYLVYWRLDHKRQNSWLLLASYVFYGSWDYRFLFLILISTVIDYIGGLGVAGVQLPRDKLRRLGALLVAAAFLLAGNIHYADLGSALLHRDGSAAWSALPHTLRELAVPLGTFAVTLLYGSLLPFLYRLPQTHRRKTFLVISMVANLAILGFFKYFDFFLVSLRALLAQLGFSAEWYTLNIILPAGISFYTFQAMSYTIDIYRGDAQPTDSFKDFALFVCFFPHLVAGPIMRAHTLLPQVIKPRPDPRGTGAMREGLVLVVIGLFKKIVIADNMAPLANAVFYRFLDGRAGDLSGAEALLGVYAFAFQIYGDFSGYSAIARGISKWLGFELVVNFDLPYLATSPSDLWRRWHISLSSWLRDYLYISLGGNRGGRWHEYRNLMLTMLLGGLWHGANWTFIAWGFYHGLILCLFRLAGWKDPRPGTAGGAERLRWLLRVVIMFHLTCVGWLLFRADTIGAAFRMGSFIVTDFAPRARLVVPFLAELTLFALIPFALDVALAGERKLNRLWGNRWWVQAPVYAYVIAMLLFLHAGKTSEFIYFQF
jgi:alginate O-acetyltransferase complex protein AlgI